MNFFGGGLYGNRLQKSGEYYYNCCGGGACRVDILSLRDLGIASFFDCGGYLCACISRLRLDKQKDKGAEKAYECGRSDLTFLFDVGSALSCDIAAYR
jgi:hypothetical protein